MAQRTIYTYNVPNVAYFEHEELINVQLDDLLRMGDLLVRRADGELVPVQVVSFFTSEGELMDVCQKRIYDSGGETVKAVPYLRD